MSLIYRVFVAFAVITALNLPYLTKASAVLAKSVPATPPVTSSYNPKSTPTPRPVTPPVTPPVKSR